MATYEYFLELNHGKLMRYDAEDDELALRYKWRWQKSKMDSGYAVTNVPVGRIGHKKGVRRKRKLAHFHAEVIKAMGSDGLEADHKNGDGLDNRRENLRPGTRTNQCQNRRPMRGASSRYKGVDLWMGKWRARIRINGRSKHLGYFKDEVDAATAYNFMAEEHFGEFARINLLSARAS